MNECSESNTHNPEHNIEQNVPCHTKDRTNPLYLVKALLYLSFSELL